MNEENITVISAAETQTKTAKSKRTDAEKLRECYEKRERLQEQKTAHRSKGQAIDKSIAENNAKIAELENKELLKICREKKISAQNFLKPTKDNSLLISKNAKLVDLLSIAKFESSENKKLANSKEKKIENLTHELEMKNKLFNDYVGIMKKMEQCIIEKNALIAEKDKRIAELTDKAAAFENFAERLDKLFAVFEDNANISIVQKVASGLFGKK